MDRLTVISSFSGGSGDEPTPNCPSVESTSPTVAVLSGAHAAALPMTMTEKETTMPMFDRWDMKASNCGMGTGAAVKKRTRRKAHRAVELPSRGKILPAPRPPLTTTTCAVYESESRPRLDVEASRPG